jgi:hypothetical protein
MSPTLSMQRNLENIIHYSHSRGVNDIIAIFIAVNSSDKSLQDLSIEAEENYLTQDKAEKLVQIICDQKLSKGILIVGNKRTHLRYHESILHSISELTQIGES